MKVLKDTFRFYKLILQLFLSPSFLILTFVGNSIIVLFSYVFFLIEEDLNSSIHTFLDALWWGFATATTVGYGDIVAVTAPGKIVGIALMLIGTALFATYTALFAQTILEDEFFRHRFKKKN